jgi:hypothetical protein
MQSIGGLVCMVSRFQHHWHNNNFVSMEQSAVEH